MKWPKNKSVSKSEAIRAMLDGRKIFMTMWYRFERHEYAYFDGDAFRYDTGEYFNAINTSGGDFRVIEEN